MNTAVKTGFKEELNALLGDRVRFDEVERLLYSHDMGVMPKQIKRFIKTLPHAVCQPTTEEEVMELMQIATKYKIPVVPRGAGTAGFGGAVPTKGGIVVDTARLQGVIALDKDALTATVHAGTVFSDLQSTLIEQGLALRLYPSSAVSATVGGWAAMEGAGYGSYMYSYFSDNITSLTLILPTGEKQVLAGEQLKMATGTCGITGVITSITIKIMQQSDEKVTLLSFDTLSQLSTGVSAMKGLGIPAWSSSILLPSFISLMNEADGHTTLDSNRYYLSIAYLARDTAEADASIKALILSTGARKEPGDLAKKEWEEKFYPMRFKKLGPSLIASEVVIPVEKLEEFVQRVEKKFKGAFALEGTMIGSGEIAVLGFMLSDERKAGYPLAYVSSLSVLGIAEKLGGRVYSTGLYFANKSQELLGKDLLQDLWAFKQSVDPHGIMNPGKVIPASLDKKSPSSMIWKMMSAAGLAKDIIGLTGRMLCSFESTGLSGNIPAALEDDTFSCALCGYCRQTCTVYSAQPWESNSPRGKYFLLNQYSRGEIKSSEGFIKSLNICTTCKKCDDVCQIKSHNAHNWLMLKEWFHRSDFINTGLDTIRDNVLGTGNFWGVPKEKQEQWLDVPTQKTGKIGYWGGCWANVVMPNMAQNITRIIDKAGVDFVNLGDSATCCGLYLLLGGYADDYQEFVLKNIQSMKDAGIEKLVLSCPGCYANFSENYKAIADAAGVDFDVKFVHATVFMNELVENEQLVFENPYPHTITYHDSCHIGRWFGHYDEPRNVLKATGANVVEMESTREKSLCCGLVAAFDNLQVVSGSGLKRVNEAEATGADFVITTCAGCGSQINATCNAAGTKVKQKDITDIVAEALGLPVDDPTERIGTYMSATVEMLQKSGMKKRIYKQNKK
ncbi:FAD-binding and (Fe-S)-binding domain-containing protein [Desulfopila sp. IMCC35008]|uniref:FAD-binding and (Fe-S)-binding domain-containing protein n=1 Tax=Desulfopila sp. IMCC35008 TaxID=2653858 RepID=UPI0013D651F9|nr:FAD-binding and (Fe-S)-binding domain-containing protein [Desulfopila sp. IMCC35008]